MADRVPAVVRGSRPASRIRRRLRARRPPRLRLALPGSLRRRGGRIAAFLALLGPGLIAANAGNDAGGIATYAQAGARYGYGLLWMMVLITFSLALVQCLAARMGVVTGKGLAELVRESYGIRWSAFATLAVLIANVGICISDFVGVGAAFGLAGIPVQVSVPIVGAAIWLILVRGSYRVGHAIAPPHIRLISAYVLLFVATAGTTITPYMQLYLQSAIVARGCSARASWRARSCRSRPATSSRSRSGSRRVSATAPGRRRSSSASSRQ